MGFGFILLLSNILLSTWLSTAKGNSFFDEEDEFPMSFQEHLCDIPQFKNGYLYDEESWRHNFPGKKYSYKCDNGFSPPSGHSWDYLYCTAQGWKPEVPCVRQCVFHYVEDGESSYREEIYLQGQSLKFQCQNGYRLLNDQDTMTCTENGWSPSPKCIPISTCSVSDIEIENGFFSESDFTYDLNRETSYRCKQGYVTNTGETSGSITCLQNGWSHQPSCIKSCERPVFENSITENNSTWFKLNDKLGYECLIGYENEYKHTKGSITCTYYGWSDMPSCYEKECSIPILHPKLVVSPRKEKYRVGDLLEFSCRSGHRVGPDSVQCYHFGWSPSFPTCKEKICSPPIIPNGFYTPHRSIHGTDDEIRYGCNNGFYPATGSTVSKCTITGWIPVPRCIWKCIFHYVENGKSSHWEKIYVQGQTVKVQCHNGYSLPNDQDTMTCTENGWSPPPKCIRITDYCVNPPHVPNATIVTMPMAKYPSGERVHYECHKPFELFGKVEVMCQNGMWTEPPRCKDPTGKCGPPPPIDNGDITSLSLPVYASLSSVEYQCQKYYLLKGNKKITCRNGKWSEPPTCLSACIISEDILERHKILLKWKQSQKVYSQSGDVIEFLCKPGYRKARGSPSFRAKCMNGHINYPTCV